LLVPLPGRALEGSVTITDETIQFNLH